MQRYVWDTLPFFLALTISTKQKYESILLAGNCSPAKSIKVQPILINY